MALGTEPSQHTEPHTCEMRYHIAMRPLMTKARNNLTDRAHMPHPACTLYTLRHTDSESWVAGTIMHNPDAKHPYLGLLCIPDTVYHQQTALGIE